MNKALIALHYQNDVCHPDGVVPFSIDRTSGEADGFLARSRMLIDRARQAEWLVVHVHIAFQPDYSDLPRNCRLFRAVETLGAVRRGSWGAAAMQGFEPAKGEPALIHTANNAFHQPDLANLLDRHGIVEIAVAGLATQYSVEHTVRHAADLGYAVTMVRDCCASSNAAAAEASFAAMALLADVKVLDDMIF